MVNGEKREETCFIDVAFMGKTAEITNQYLQKGSKVFIDGRLKFDQWTDNNGLARSKHSIVVDKMVMLDSKKQDSNDKEPQQEQQPPQLISEQLDEQYLETNKQNNIFDSNQNEQINESN